MFFGLKRFLFFFGGVILTLYPAISFAESTNVTRYALLPETAVLARANGRELTKADVERDLKLRIRLMKHRKATFSASEERNLSLSYRKGALRQFVREVLLDEAAAAAGVTNETAMLERYKRNAFKGFKTAKDKSFEDLKRIKGLDAGRLEAQVARETLAATMEARWCAEEPFKPEEGYVDKVMANIRRVNELAMQTNAIQFAKATNAWERLKAGEDFQKVGLEMTELPEEREDALSWGDYDEMAFDEVPELLAALKPLAIGGFTQPCEADNGLMIARLDARDPEDGTMSLSRIFFHLAVIYAIPTPQEILAGAEREHGKKVVAARREALWKAARIEFPYTRLDFAPLKEDEEE